MKNLIRIALCALLIGMPVSADVLQVRIKDAYLGSAGVTFGSPADIVTNYHCIGIDPNPVTTVTYNGIRANIITELPDTDVSQLRHTTFYLYADYEYGTQFWAGTFTRTNGVWTAVTPRSDCSVYVVDQNNFWTVDDLVRDGTKYVGPDSYAQAGTLSLTNGTSVNLSNLRNNPTYVTASNVRNEQGSLLAVNYRYVADITVTIAPESFFHGDFDQSGTKDMSDVYAFLECWFAGDSRADQNFDTNLSVDDFFSFIESWVSL